MKNKGLTLVEIVVTLAILGMVIVLVTGFMNTGIKTTSRANIDTNLQKEAQISLNQISDWVMSANHGIAVYDSCGYYTKAVGIYHDGKNSEDRYVQILYYRQTDNKVYYDKVLVDASFHGTESEIQTHAASIHTGNAWNKYLLCEYVKEFDLDISKLNEKYVELKLVFELKGIQYNQYPKKITLRNEPVINPTDYK